MPLKHVIAGLTAGLVLATAGAVLADHGQPQTGDHQAEGSSVTASLAAGTFVPPGQAAHGVLVWAHGKHKAPESGDQAGAKPEDQGASAHVLASTATGTATEATVVATTASSVTLESNPAQLPANLGVVTTGGPQVKGTLPLASGVQILATGDDQAATGGTAATLTAGEHVRVWIDGGQVTAILVQAQADGHGDD